jgi:hypothetical protein
MVQCKSFRYLRRENILNIQSLSRTAHNTRLSDHLAAKRSHSSILNIFPAVKPLNHTRILIMLKPTLIAALSLIVLSGAATAGSEGANNAREMRERMQAQIAAKQAQTPAQASQGK